jgi:hypothetical protein
MKMTEAVTTATTPAKTPPAIPKTVLKLTLPTAGGSSRSAEAFQLPVHGVHTQVQNHLQFTASHVQKPPQLPLVQGVCAEAEETSEVRTAMTAANKTNKFIFG